MSQTNNHAVIGEKTIPIYSHRNHFSVSSAEKSVGNPEKSSSSIHSATEEALRRKAEHIPFTPRTSASIGTVLSISSMRVSVEWRVEAEWDKGGAWRRLRAEQATEGEVVAEMSI